MEILRVRENTYSVVVYFNDPHGSGLEVYYEEPGGFRWAWEGRLPGSSWFEMVALS